MKKVDTVETTLYSLLTDSANAAIEQQRDDGSLPAGTNGPWRQQETPVRNTSHWAIVFKKVYEITQDIKYKQAMEAAGRYLLSEARRPHGATFKHREGTEIDQSNGLIGQAWTIEALSEIFAVTGDSAYIDEASEVFLLHPFDEEQGLWQRVKVDGGLIKKDPTFNHQLWFAAAGGLIAKYNDEIQKRVKTFLNKMSQLLRIHENGRIYHSLLPKFGLGEYVQYLCFGDRYLPLLNIRQKYRNIAPQYDINYKTKEIGYHAFNLYGLAMLKQSFREHEVWDSEIVQQSLNYILRYEYQNNIDQNPYGYPYNPPGFEVPFAAHVFEIKKIDSKRWLETQIHAHFDFDRSLLSRNTPDPETLAARIYEATRLPDYNIKV